MGADVKPVLVDDHSLTLTQEHPSKLSIEPDGKNGPRLLFANPLEKDIPGPDEPNVVYIRVHGEGQQSFARLKPVVNQFMHRKVPGFVRDVRFENVRITGTQGDYPVQLAGADAEHDVSDVTFRNVQIVDTPLTKESPHARIGQHVKSVRFSNEFEDRK